MALKPLRILYIKVNLFFSRLESGCQPSSSNMAETLKSLDSCCQQNVQHVVGPFQAGICISAYSIWVPGWSLSPLNSIEGLTRERYSLALISLGL